MISLCSQNNYLKQPMIMLKITHQHSTQQNREPTFKISYCMNVILGVGFRSMKINCFLRVYETTSGFYGITACLFSISSQQSSTVAIHQKSNISPSTIIDEMLLCFINITMGRYFDSYFFFFFSILDVVDIFIFTFSKSF